MNPKEITVAPPETSAETIKQGLIIVSHGDGRKPGGGQKEKRSALRKLIASEDVKDALIFCNRKRDISTLHRSMTKHGYSVGQLHGDMAQPARMEMLQRFKENKFTYMVCSDVAARGLDIPALSHVFNFDVPSHAEDYVHRIGRTGRAGIEGHAFTIAVPEDKKYLDAIIKLIGREIPKVDLDGKKIVEPAKQDVKEEAPGKVKETVKQEIVQTDNVSTLQEGSNRKLGVRGPRHGRAENKNAKLAKLHEAQPQTQKKHQPENDSGNENQKFGDSDNVPAFMRPPGDK